MSSRNRLANCHNQFQNQKEFPRALCVCSAGLLRSPTLAFVLARDFNFNTRAAGSSPAFALVPVDDVLLEWADWIFFVNKENEEEVDQHFKLETFENKGKRIVTLNIPDRFNFRDPELEKIIRLQVEAALRKASEQEAS